MLNRNSFKAVSRARFGRNHSVMPLYTSYCSSNIGKTIENVLVGGGNSGLPIDVLGKLRKRYDHIVLFIVDGFGWSLFEKTYKTIPFLRKVVQRGIVSQLTSQFPSTTAAQITSLHTGLPVGEHGLYEWFYYEKTADAVIAPLLFSFAEDKVRNTLQKIGVDPKKIFPNTTLYERLKKKGVLSSSFIPQEYFPSPYSDAVLKGSHLFGYRSISEGFTNLALRLNNGHVPSYDVFYCDKIDSIAHHYGALSSHTCAEVDALFGIMERNFIKKLKGGNILFIVTADHGQVTIRPETTTYLNDIVPSLEKKFLKTKMGRPIVPAGGYRDMFLYVKDEFLEEVRIVLKEKLRNVAEVYETKVLKNKGFFGPKVDLSLLERVGNLIIIPREGKLVWWRDEKFKVTHHGHHGGLSAEEMIVPLICFEN